jgi:peptidoglycan/LPS O-acetylase OafA/YrhL
MAKSLGADYRSDVDGLRALAVIAVIVFHANVNWLPGGFAGVDVFFVISGFLISGLISREVEEGRFSFRAFYARRIRRILPALAVVCAFTAMGSLYLLNVNDLFYFTTSLAACWLFASNIFFSLLSSGYFDPRLEQFPLLHTWSLGVEEQFYFAFPIALLLLLKYQKRHALKYAVAATIIFVWLSQTHATVPSAYYHLQYRAHELLLGFIALLAIQELPVNDQRTADIVCALGLLLVLGSFFALNAHSVFPGLNSLYPCVGTVCVIYSGGSATWVRRCVTNRPIVFAGLLSYSLYLWHWPLLALLRYRGIELDPLFISAVVALTIALSYLTWRFVEKPSRANSGISFRTTAIVYYVLPATVFIALAAVSYKTGGIPQRVSPNIRELMLSYSRETDLSRACSKRSSDDSTVNVASVVEKCAFGDLSQKSALVMLVGDSHASQMRPFIDVLANEAHLRAAYEVMGSCAPVLLPAEETQGDAVNVEACRRHNAALLEEVGQFKYVVLGGQWSEIKGDFEAGLTKAVAVITRGGSIPVIFRDTPAYETDRSQCVLQKARGWLPISTVCEIPYVAVVNQQSASNRAIDDVKMKFPAVIVVDPKTAMCNETQCLARIGNLAMYKDSNHINEKAARALASSYLSVNSNPFTQ